MNALQHRWNQQTGAAAEEQWCNELTRLGAVAWRVGAGVSYSRTDFRLTVPSKVEMCRITAQSVKTAVPYVQPPFDRAVGQSPRQTMCRRQTVIVSNCAVPMSIFRALPDPTLSRPVKSFPEMCGGSSVCRSASITTVRASTGRYCALRGGHRKDVPARLAGKTQGDTWVERRTPPSLGKHILTIVLCGPQKQMVRTSARRVIAPVQNLQSVRDRAIRLLPRESVCQYELAVTFSHLSVARGILRMLPDPTVTCSVEPLPEIGITCAPCAEACSVAVEAIATLQRIGVCKKRPAAEQADTRFDGKTQTHRRVGILDVHRDSPFRCHGAGRSQRRRSFIITSPSVSPLPCGVAS
jgi:hypothetical protein